MAVVFAHQPLLHPQPPQPLLTQLQLQLLPPQPTQPPQPSTSTSTIRPSLSFVASRRCWVPLSLPLRPNSRTAPLHYRACHLCRVCPLKPEDPCAPGNFFRSVHSYSYCYCDAILMIFLILWYVSLFPTHQPTLALFSFHFLLLIRSWVVRLTLGIGSSGREN